MNEIAEKERAGQLQLKDRNEASNYLVHDLLNELDKDYSEFISTRENSTSIEQLENAVAVFMNKAINVHNSIANIRNTLNFLSQG